jgi:hypothetical protein
MLDFVVGETIYEVDNGVAPGKQFADVTTQNGADLIEALAKKNLYIVEGEGTQVVTGVELPGTMPGVKDVIVPRVAIREAIAAATSFDELKIALLAALDAGW